MPSFGQTHLCDADALVREMALHQWPNSMIHVLCDGVICAKQHMAHHRTKHESYHLAIPLVQEGAPSLLRVPKNDYIVSI